MLTDPIFYLFAVPAVILLGLAKGGFAGVGAIAVPLMALAAPPIQAASVILPILLVQDVVSVWAFRRSWDRSILARMLPGAALGILLGYLLASRVPGGAVELAVGIISILFGVHRLWTERRGAVAGTPGSWPFALICGVASGFTSQIAHAGGPPFQIYALARGLGRDVFIGTSAIFFAVVNWLKAPAYLALGQLTRENLLTSAVLLPLAIASTVAGVVLVRRVSGETFYRIIYVLLLLVGARLVWDGLTSLGA
ncbi:MAG: sulfite exporter TauE/SafE family protein [Proteobacteria bacterium]|nr:sulfite exporter TauE/SafE family protein [Pseudomonadota bacterium]